MNALRTLKTITILGLLTAIAANAAPQSPPDEQLRCEARSLQIEAKVLRCVATCRT